MRLLRCVAPALLAGSLLLAPAGLAAPAPEPGEPPPSVPASNPGLRRVIVELAVPSRPRVRRERRAGGRASRQERRDRQDRHDRHDRRIAIAAMQGELEEVLRGRGARALRRFRDVPFVAIEADSDTLDALRASPMVRSIEPDRLFRPTLAQSAPLIGADAGAAAGAASGLFAVAVLDTGVDSSHPALAGRIVDEACFSATGDCPSGGDEEFGPGAGRDCPQQGCFHGTHVAGIAASADPLYTGVAPGALLVPIQVFSSFSGPICQGAGEDPCVLSYASDQIAALEYVLELSETRFIAAVNMSLGGQAYTSQAACDAANFATKAAIDALRAERIATVISSGNGGFLDRLSAPACISSAVSVGATTKSDGIPVYSNSASFLSLLAPGSSITSTIPLTFGAPFGTASGTSMSAPHVAGAWAVLRGVEFDAGVAEVLGALQATGLAITDVNGVTASRIAVDEAAALLQLPDCQDGIDNDGDGLADFPEDTGCGSVFGLVEDPACSDGLDNDGDRLVDFPQDPGCASATGFIENPPPYTGVSGGFGCGLGFEVAPLLVLLARLRRRRQGALAASGSRSIP